MSFREAEEEKKDSTGDHEPPSSDDGGGKAGVSKRRREESEDDDDDDGAAASSKRARRSSRVNTDGTNNRVSAPDAAAGPMRASGDLSSVGAAGSPPVLRRHESFDAYRNGARLSMAPGSAVQRLVRFWQKPARVAAITTKEGLMDPQFMNLFAEGTPMAEEILKKADEMERSARTAKRLAAAEKDFEKMRGTMQATLVKYGQDPEGAKGRVQSFINRELFGIRGRAYDAIRAEMANEISEFREFRRQNSTPTATIGAAGRTGLRRNGALPTGNRRTDQAGSAARRTRSAAGEDTKDSDDDEGNAGDSEGNPIDVGGSEKNSGGSAKAKEDDDGSDEDETTDEDSGGD